jgi:hypothetical protein
MPDLDPMPRKALGESPTVDQVISRVQTLSQTPRQAGGYPLATYVEGYFLGDMTAIAAAVIRSERLLTG